MNRRGRTLTVALLIVAVVLAGGGVTGWLLTRPAPITPLVTADAPLAARLLDADQALTATVDNARSVLEQVTNQGWTESPGTWIPTGETTGTVPVVSPSGPASPATVPPTPSAGTAGVTVPPSASLPADPAPNTWLAVDDPAVTAVVDAMAWSRLHDVATLFLSATTSVEQVPELVYTFGNRDPVTPGAYPTPGTEPTPSPAVTVKGDDVRWDFSSPSAVDRVAGGTGQASLTDISFSTVHITTAQVSQLLAGYELADMQLGTAMSQATDALAAAKKAAVTPAYNSALKALNAAIGTASKLLTTTAGEVDDDATRQTLDKAITAATRVRDDNKLAGADTAADVVAKTKALVGATPALASPSKAVTDSHAVWVANSVVSLDVPYISQYAAGAPEGCEAASLLEALHFKGYATGYDLPAFLKQMPYAPDGNPYHGFSDTPYQNLGPDYIQSIFPAPLAAWGARYGPVADISGATIDDLKAELKAGNPVVVYVTFHFAAPVWKHWSWGDAIFNGHIMVLAGYDNTNDTYKVADPVDGVYWVDGATFEQSYGYLDWAVVVR